MDGGIQATEAHTYLNVRLSRRNLEQLQRKLDEAPPHAGEEVFCGIVRTVSPDLTILVRAEENEDHYGDRVPGHVFPGDPSGL